MNQEESEQNVDGMKMIPQVGWCRPMWKSGWWFVMRTMPIHVYTGGRARVTADEERVLPVDW